MTDSIATPETVVAPPAELLAVTANCGLEIAVVHSLEQSFTPFYAQAAQWRAKAETIKITSVEQVHEMKVARESRLALKSIRCRVEDARKKLGEDSRAYITTVNAIAARLKGMIEPTEAYLEEQEQFALRKEQEREKVITDARAVTLKELGVDTTYISLGEMPDDAYASLLAQMKIAAEAAIAAEMRAEEEAAAAKVKAEKEAAELSQLAFEAKKVAQAEKERLRQEKLAADRAVAKAKAETMEALRVASVKAREAQDAANAKLKAERDARQKVEAELIAAKNAERDRIAAELEAIRKAACAGDAEKLVACAKEIDEATPSLKDPDLNHNVMVKICELIGYLKSEHAKLTGEPEQF